MPDEPIPPVQNDASPGLLVQRERFAELYQQLQWIARRELGSRPRTSLDTGALVHEAYLKLDRGQFDSSERGAFLALAAKAMRHVLIDHVRANAADKRGGGMARVTLYTDLPLPGGQAQVDVLAIEQGLTALQALEPRLVTVVECHFYAGMEFQEIATLLGVTPRTIHRDWRKARAFLLSQLSDGAPGAA